MNESGATAKQRFRPRYSMLKREKGAVAIMADTLQDLLDDIRREDFEAFIRNVHTICTREETDLDLIFRLLVDLQIMLTEYNCDEDMEDDVYLKPFQMIPMCAYFVLTELKKLISEGVILHTDGALRQNDKVLAFAALADSLNSAAEEGDNGSEILWLAEEVLQKETNPLQRVLLDRFCDASAFTVMHMIFYLRAVPTLEALREKQQTLLHHHTRKEWGEECAKKHHTSYCYFFLEQASPAESRRMCFAQHKIETASTPREFVLAVAEADACLAHWERKIAVFPYETYMCLTDGTYEAYFRDPAA